MEVYSWFKNQKSCIVMFMDDQTNIQDGEIISEEVVTQEPTDLTDTTATDTSQTTILLDIENLIKNNFTAIDRLSQELRKEREMFADAFANDPIFKEHDEKSKQASKEKSVTRQQITKQPQIAKLADKIRTLSSEIKERKLSLSDYLLEYQRMSGANEIEIGDGTVLEIIHEARLIKKSSRK